MTLFQMSIESVPRDLRNLRACLVCSMVKTLDQFIQDGCDNCERYLNMKGDDEKVSECTRFVFLKMLQEVSVFWPIIMWLGTALNFFFDHWVRVRF